jgi:hypothetical protein
MQMNETQKPVFLTGVSLKSEFPINRLTLVTVNPWRRTVERLSLSAALASLILLIRPCYADQLVTFDFSRDLATTQSAARITAVTPLRAVLSEARQDGFTESARANSWHLPGSTNYFRFTFAIEAGYVADIEGVQFDSMSQKTISTTNGPTQYNSVSASTATHSKAFPAAGRQWPPTASGIAAWRRLMAVWR